MKNNADRLYFEEISVHLPRLLTTVDFVLSLIPYSQAAKVNFFAQRFYKIQ